MRGAGDMIEKLKKIKERYLRLNDEVSKPETIALQNEWRRLVKELSALTPIVEEYDRYAALEKDIADAKALLRTEKDGDMIELIDADLEVNKTALEDSLQRIKILLLPKDPDDDKNVIMEIRAGAGGDEAGLFGAQLRRMYYMYADRQRWKIEEIDANETELGGIKEAAFMVIGEGVYAKLKYESGVHRVQRVPETETQGRVHTSTATVAVLPEVEDVEVVIDDKDLKIDTYRSSGAGGQHVNKTESAIRITHIPTGIIVACQEERSQIKNRDKAMKMLKSKIYDMQKTQTDKAYADNRKNQVGTGDRSERVRTYNFPQGRVSDHRIGLTLYSLENFINGDLDEMTEALRIADQARKLQQ
jgi:peptide chain release factor 1